MPKARALKTRETKHCEVCGKSVAVYRTQQRFCSVECSNKHHGKERSKKVALAKSAFTVQADNFRIVDPNEALKPPYPVRELMLLTSPPRFTWEFSKEVLEAAAKGIDDYVRHTSSEGLDYEAMGRAALQAAAPVLFPRAAQQ